MLLINWALCKCKALLDSAAQRLFYQLKINLHSVKYAANARDLKSLLLANDMQFILSKNKQNTKETLQVPSGADASARATV